MLQIKKTGFLIAIHNSVQFLLRSKAMTKNLPIKKHKSSVVFVRAPKNFNIGKQKISSLKFKPINFSICKNYPCTTQILFKQPNYLYKLIKKKILNTAYIVPKSTRITLQTKFKIKWLG